VRPLALAQFNPSSVRPFPRNDRSASIPGASVSGAAGADAAAATERLDEGTRGLQAGLGSAVEEGRIESGLGLNVRARRRDLHVRGPGSEFTYGSD
jgi:hypothetical protein